MKKITYIKKIFIYLSFILIAFLIAISAKVNAAIAPVEMVWTWAGEDASTELMVAWHSNYPEGTLYWTLDSDTTFKNAIEIKASGVYDNTSYEYDKISFYEFKVSVKDLIPDTKYRYRIKCGTTTSKAYTCKTAGTAGNFNFLWIGDYHTYKVDSCQTRYTYVNQFVSQLEKANFNFDLVVSSGDNVSYGGSYDNYQVMNSKINFFSSKVFASTTGNHDYYGSHNQYPDSSVNIDNRFFESVFTHPDNGIGNPLDSSYWFIYNSVMFVMLDSLAAGYSHTLAAQKEWFGKVVSENEGRFQYLIVMEHYPWMNALTGEHSGPYTSNYNQWYQLFDRYGVDLALAGDHHVYYRSKFIYEGKIYDEDNQGTMYVGCPQIGDRYRTITDRKDPEYYAIRIDDVADDPNRLANYSGCTRYTVTPNGIKGELFDTNGDVKDTYEIKAKRQVNWADKKDSILDTLKASNNGTKTYIDFSPAYAEYISKIRLYDDSNNIIAVEYPAKYGTSFLTVENLNPNTTYNYKLVIDYVDGTVNNVDYTFGTYGDYGTFDSFKASPNNDKLVLSWNQELKNDVVKKYKIYQDDTLVEEISSSNQKYEINKASTNLNSTYKIQALNESGNVVFEKTTIYLLAGDANYDGSINDEDVKALFKSIQASYQFKNNEKTLLDLNKDGSVDVGDAILIYEFAGNKISELTEAKLFTVTILNKDGSIDSTTKLPFGASIELPNISDADFLYYTDNGKYITGDLVIRPVYK